MVHSIGRFFFWLLVIFSLNNKVVYTEYSMSTKYYGRKDNTLTLFQMWNITPPKPKSEPHIKSTISQNVANSKKTEDTTLTQIWQQRTPKPEPRKYHKQKKMTNYFAYHGITVMPNPPGYNLYVPPNGFIYPEEEQNDSK